MEYHVAKNGCDANPGTQAQPFLTISKAAKVAMPGDIVTVHEGIYREWVKPENGGTSNITRITYQAAEGEKVVIKGSEQIKGWEKVEGSVWKVTVSNSMFGDYNPYNQPLEGDWFVYPKDYLIHTGDVYVNGESFYEVASLDEVKNPVMKMEGFCPPWTQRKEYILRPERTIYVWYCEVEKDTTTIYANFHEYDPNQELTEINVRKCCFYPEKTARNYITVRGFEMAQAACPWAPPTAEQPGLLGVNWSKGWIIENNHIHDAKCSGISIGKEETTGHNLATRTHLKPGYQYQLESVFRAVQIGWSKEKVGSHIIRNNIIHDCGQNGIVGHMGCVFSEIHHNHIYNIAKKHEFFGHEIAGIKLHAALDVQIHHNNIHNCTLGTWLDWQAQGTRISKNIYHSNDRDMMIEVTSGPLMIDNNIFASKYNFDNVAQGTAYINNLCCGVMRRAACLNRSTPYHFPHTTQVAGCALVYSGDDRLYQNIFVGGAPVYRPQMSCGTAGYNDCTASLEEYIEKVKAHGKGDVELFEREKQPAYINKNCYLNDAPAFDREADHYCSQTDPHIQVVTKNNETYLEINVEPEMLSLNTKVFATEDLGLVRIVEAPYDDPQGHSIRLDSDLLDQERTCGCAAGPISNLTAGFNRILIWKDM